MGIFASKRTSNKANIVLVHGFWADGSGWSKVIPTLQAQGHFVIAEQNAATSLADDVATTRQILAELKDLRFWSATRMAASSSLRRPTTHREWLAWSISRPSSLMRGKRFWALVLSFHPWKSSSICSSVRRG